MTQNERIEKFFADMDVLKHLVLAFDQMRDNLTDEQANHIASRLRQIMQRLEDEGTTLKLQLQCGLN